jgi:glutamate/leucine/phenylalanine/valine dehydrogenase
MAVTGIVPAYRSPLMQELFAVQTFRSGVLPNLATAERPADGFSPTRLANGTEVLFIPRPEALGPELASRMAPLWENGLGLVLYRNEAAQVLGAIFLHGAIRNGWNAIQSGAYQCLGGVMLFSDDPREAKSEEALIADVVRKSTAMTTKWQFIDENLARIGHPVLTNLGGGKSTASHPAGEKGRYDAVAVTASVARELGVYISGSDQNMTPALCTYFAEQAPCNFMGAKDHVLPAYGGMADPSPWTARGVYEALKAARRLHLGDRKVPIFFQGYGNVGRPMVRFAVEDGHPAAGIIDINVKSLERAREDGIDAPLFLQVSETSEISRGVMEIVDRLNITLVTSLVSALRQSPQTTVFSPNAGPHPISSEVADYLGNSEIRLVAGAANNVFDTVDGSIEPLALHLQKQGIFVPNDSETNQMGALSVTVQRIGLNEDGLMRAAIGVGSLTELSYEAFRNGTPPQIARDREAKRRFNRLVMENQAAGGPFPGVDETAEVTT